MKYSPMEDLQSNKFIKFITNVLGEHKGMKFIPKKPQKPHNDNGLSIMFPKFLSIMTMLLHFRSQKQKKSTKNNTMQNQK